MTKKFLSICVLTILACCVYGFWMDPKIRVHITVIDQDGKVVPNAYVSAVFYKPVGSETVRGETDKNGKATITGRSRYYITTVTRKDGYYETRVEKVAISRRENGKPVYFDPEVKMVIRKIKNPIPMYARKELKIALPVINQPVGFDLIECDLVAPYGKGRHSDFIFEVSGYHNNVDDFESNLKLTFANEGDGIVPFKGFFTSELWSPYEAPESGYQPVKTWRISRKPNPNPDIRKGIPAIVGVYPDKRANYFFRVRTKLDGQGNVTEAFYGKIYGDFFSAVDDKGRGWAHISCYYLNPTPNDRNVEFDPRHNLFKDLDSLDKVLKP